MITFLFIIGLFFLIYAADWLVEGASTFAKRFHIPELVIGLTVVAFGTSAPELIVNVLASLGGKGEIAFGNVLGSNVANILLVLGISACIFPLIVPKSTLRFEIPTSLLGLVILFFLAYNGTPWKINSPQDLGRTDGFLLLLLFFSFFGYTILLTLRHRKTIKLEFSESTEQASLTFAGVKIIAGMLGLFLGGKWVVEGAITFAQFLHVSEGLIAITIVAIGTSLPELATSVVAARKKRVSIIVGNAIGSNIFNLLWVLGLSSAIAPIKYQAYYNFDILINLLAGGLILLFTFKSSSRSLGRKSGVFFLVIYAFYIIVSVYMKGPVG